MGHLALRLCCAGWLVARGAAPTAMTPVWPSHPVCFEVLCVEPQNYINLAVLSVLEE